jgi:hypothetical protein
MPNYSLIIHRQTSIATGHERHKRAVIAVLAGLGVAAIVGWNIYLTVKTNRNAAAIQDLRNKLQRIAEIHLVGIKNDQSREVTFELLFETLVNSTARNSDRLDIVDYKLDVLTHVRRNAVSLLCQGGILPAVNDFQLTDQLSNPYDLWQAVKTQLPKEMSKDLVFDNDPFLLQSFSTFVATNADTMTGMLSGQLHFPLIKNSTLYHLVKPVHAGVFSPDMSLFAVPILPETIAVPARRSSASHNDVRYVDIRDCVSINGHPYHICDLSKLHTAPLPSTSLCPIPPTAHCDWHYKDVRPGFLHSVNLGGGLYSIATNIQRYTKVVNAFNHSSTTEHQVTKPVDVYAIPFNTTLAFGRHMLHGGANMHPKVPDYVHHLVANVSFPKGLAPGVARNFKIIRARMDIHKKELALEEKAATELVEGMRRDWQRWVQQPSILAILAAVVVVVVLGICVACYCLHGGSNSKIASPNNINLHLNTASHAPPTATATL